MTMAYSKYMTAFALFSMSGSVMAAGTYVLTDVGYWNAFSADGAIPSITGPLPNAGTATVTTGDAFTATGVQFVDLHRKLTRVLH
jgi:hypothetical protein